MVLAGRAAALGRGPGGRALGAAGGLRDRGQAARPRRHRRDRDRVWRCRGARPPRPGGAPLGTVRAGAIVAVIGAALVVAIPFAANGRVGILGQGLINDDMASHLLFTEWVDTREGRPPDLVEDGYPLGPHAVVAAAAKVDRRRADRGLRRADRRDRGPAGADRLRRPAAGCAIGCALRPRCSPPCRTSARPTWRRARSRSRCSASPCSASRSSLPVWDRAPPTLHVRTAAGLDAAGAAGIPARRDRRGHDLQLQLPRPRLADRRGGRLGLIVAWSERGERAGAAPGGAGRSALAGDRSGSRPGGAALPGAGSPGELRELRGLQPLGRGRQHRLRQPPPAAQPARGPGGLALERVPDRARRTRPPPRSPSTSAACWG